MVLLIIECFSFLYKIFAVLFGVAVEENVTLDKDGSVRKIQRKYSKKKKS